MNFRKFSYILLIILLILISCESNDIPEEDTDTPNEPVVTIDITESEPEETPTAETTEEPIHNIDDITVTDTSEEEETSEPESETTTEEEVKIIDKFVNPLTGLKGTVEMSNKRPVAIMINNIKPSLPQEGISSADIMYECLVEGGATRLMMLYMNYEDLGVIGSVRSSRDYYLDFAQNHDAIYIHAGGSPLAYDNIQSRRINTLDGVNMALPVNVFYRDAERRKTMSAEHTLMTTGAGIVKGIDFKKYRTEVKENFVSPLNFVDYNSERIISGNNLARHVIIPYNNSQFPQYIYNSRTKTYLRYQFNGMAHMDASNDTQLEFNNIILLVCTHGDLNDDKGRIGVYTTGSGDGYYIYGGKYEKIKWSKATRDSVISLTNTDDTPLVINCGKTAVNIISPGVEKVLELNYVKPKN
ncbi:MAG: DUF3048 domain-containing protein [Oscillospiraceae bacterium]|nr:DUF3048 domain-containing protein [Oscillospiraceae bacterium]